MSLEKKDNFILRKISKIKRKLIRKLELNYRSLSKKYRKEPIEIYAFIRVKNEIVTVEESLRSIEGILTKGVIGYNKKDNEIDDGTEKVILDFCNRNKGFKAIRYPYEVIAANDIRYKSLEEIPFESRIDTYYNEIFKYIPDGAWFMKVDCDHIFDREKIKKLPFLPKTDRDSIIFSRMNFHYENKKLYVINIHTIAANGEWKLMKKDKNLNHELRTGYREDGTFFAWELLVDNSSDRKTYYTDLFNWHFPFVKSSRKLDKKHFTPFEEYIVTDKIRKEFYISDDMLDQKRILKICENFKIS